MAISSFRVRLFNTIRDALYTSSNASVAALIPSLDLIKIISRLAGPHEQLVLWQSSTLHSLPLDPMIYSTPGGGDNKSETPAVVPQLIAERSPDNTWGVGFPALSVEFRRAAGEMRRYAISIAPQRDKIRILQSNIVDAGDVSFTTGTGTSTTTTGLTGTSTSPGKSTINDESQGVIATVTLDPSDTARLVGDLDSSRIALSPPPLRAVPEFFPVVSRSSDATDSAANGSGQSPWQSPSSSLEPVPLAASPVMVGSLFVLHVQYNAEFESHQEQKSLSATGRSEFESFPYRLDLIVRPPTLRAATTTGTSSTRWTALRLPPFARMQSALAFDPVTQMVYMCGGTDGTAIDSPQPIQNARYSVVDDRWCTLPAAKHNRRKHVATVYRSHLVMWAGFWAGSECGTVEALALDLVTGDRRTSIVEWVEWPSPYVVQHQPSVSLWFRYHSLVVLDNQLFVSFSEPAGDSTLALSSVWRVMCLVWDNSDPVSAPSIVVAAADSKTPHTARGTTTSSTNTKPPTPIGWCHIHELFTTLSAYHRSEERFLLVV